MIKLMKKSTRNFIFYLAVMLFSLQLANVLILQDNCLQTENNMRVLSNSSNVIYSNNLMRNKYNTEKYYINNLTNTSTSNIPCFIRNHNPGISYLYSQISVDESAKKLTEHLPEHFQYKLVNKDALKGYLQTRSSLLREEPYFSSIINVAQEFNINPILLFAITGQEQGFVPQTELSAMQIANNPYNVFCSWKDYNTNIVDSSEIACRTIINLSKDKPESIDTLAWINRKYSADQNWSNGVRSLYNDINSFIENYK